MQPERITSRAEKTIAGARSPEGELHQTTPDNANGGSEGASRQFREARIGPEDAGGGFAATLFSS